LAICARFVELGRKRGFLTTTSAAAGGGKFKSVNHCDKNFTRDLMHFDAAPR